MILYSIPRRERQRNRRGGEEKGGEGVEEEGGRKGEEKGRGTGGEREIEHHVGEGG